MKPSRMLSTTTYMFIEVANHYQLLWNFPNYMDVKDGDHTTTFCHIAVGSEFYKYKGNISILCLPLLNYRFIVIYRCENTINIYYLLLIFRVNLLYNFYVNW